MNLDSLISLYNAVPTDWMIIGAVAIFAAFDTLRSGARRTCTFAFALPVTYVLIGSVPQAVVLGGIAGQFSTPLLQAILFFIILAVIYVTVSRIGLSWGGEAGQTIQAALAGVAGTALLVVFWLQIPALSTLYHFGADVQNIFGESYRFFWIIGSYAALAFVRNA